MQADLLKFMLKAQPLTNIECLMVYMLADNPWKHCSMVMGETRYPVYDVWAGG